VQILTYTLRYAAVTAMTVRIAVLWFVMPFSLVDIYRYFVVSFYLHHQINLH